MKKTTLGILTFLLFAVLTYSLQNYDKFKVMQITDSSHAYIDLNKNKQIDDEELVKIYGISTFNNISTPNRLKTNSFLLDYFGKIYTEQTLNDKLVNVEKINSSEYKIFIDKKDFSNEIISKGLAFPEKEEYKKSFDIDTVNKFIKTADSKNYVILNLNNNKYHKLNCEFGKGSYNYKIVAENELPKNASKCNSCLVNHTKNKIQEETILTIPTYKTFDNITIYFLNYKNLKPTSACANITCKSLINEINQAKNSIDFAIYGINKEPEIIRALENASKRGVQIRWVTDFDKQSEDYYPDTKTLMQKIKSYITDSAETINYINKKDKRAIMHNKFFIFDNQKVWTGSANITNTDLSEFNANYSILINSQQIAQIYKKEFEQLYAGKFHNLKQSHATEPFMINKNTKITVLYSPQDKVIQSKIIPLIDNAQSYIYIPIFYFTHKDLANHLISAKQKGVDVKVITDSTNAHGKYTIHKSLRDAGIKVKTENKAGKMHMKTIIIDDKISVIGSMNFTKSAEYNNDENTMIIENADISKYLKQTFLTMWNEIPNKYLYRDPMAESYESIGSCNDGIDNDFDGLIDKQDDSCKFIPTKKPKSKAK